jgi:hypothetical protein
MKLTTVLQEAFGVGIIVGLLMTIVHLLSLLFTR